MRRGAVQRRLTDWDDRAADMPSSSPEQSFHLNANIRPLQQQVNGITRPLQSLLSESPTSSTCTAHVTLLLSLLMPGSVRAKKHVGVNVIGPWPGWDPAASHGRPAITHAGKKVHGRCSASKRMCAGDRHFLSRGGQDLECSPAPRGGPGGL